ncbi:MAG: DNA alkylation repair protein [Candidatus Gracilibacteria bacterium]
MKELIKELATYSDKKRAKHSAGFFKTGKGEYGEGDIFIGVRVPEQRIVAKKYFKKISIWETFKLLNSKIHEQRLTALIILDYKFPKLSDQDQKEVVDLYLKNTKYINNWDLVDSSAHLILGAYMIKHKEDRKILYKLAKSKNIWERRIAMLTTFAFIKKNDYKDALKIAEILLKDSHDLIHKAVGWMLREIGNRNLKVEEDFLMKYCEKMPRVMLRYAIEKFNDEKKKIYYVVVQPKNLFLN